MTRTRSYAGVGSRETPPPAMREIRAIAAALARLGFTLNSGGADGADTAFEDGAKTVPGAPMQIFLPWKGFNKNPSPLFGVSAADLALAATVHPRWDSLVKTMTLANGEIRQSNAAQKLHGRNCKQVLGPNLDDPVDAVICWTSDGATCERETSSKTGGTGTAIRLASRKGIPVFNLNNGESRRALAQWLASLGIRDILSLEPPVPEQISLL